MNRFEPGGDAFLTISQTTSGISSDSEEPMPTYLTRYPKDAELIHLPGLQSYQPLKNDFKTLVEERRTNRHYDTKAFLTLPQLSWLLWSTQGMSAYSERKGITTRNVPSAGSRHPFETYLLIQRVESLNPGLYHFVPQEHAIYLADHSREKINEIHQSTYNQKQVIDAAVHFIWTANVYRTSWRYHERAYRYLFLDAGHVCQNLYLAAESEGQSVCAIGAFKDIEANQALGLDGHENFVIYMASVGKALK